MPFYLLPSEIQIEIFTYLQGPDLKAVRRVCRAFRDNAEPILFRHVIAAARYQLLGAFQKIALFPVFQKHVREIVFDGSVYDQVLAKNESFYHKQAVNFPNLEQGFSYHKRSRWKRYAQLFREQEEMKSDGVLVQTILRALDWLPNISCITYSPHPRHLPIEAKDTRDLIPRGVSFSPVSRDGTSTDHPFRLLIAALYMSQYTGINELKTEPLSAKPGTGFALGIFDLDEDEMAAAKFLFQHLEKLALSMVLWVPLARQFSEILDKFATLLQSSIDLQHFHLHLTKWKSEPGPPVRLFTSLGLQTKWSKLQSLSFECVSADEDEILGIIKRHKKTLNSVRFGHCSISKGAWADIVDEVVYGTTIAPFALDCVYETVLPNSDHSMLSTMERERWQYEGHVATTEEGDRHFVEDNAAKQSVYDTRK